MKCQCEDLSKRLQEKTKEISVLKRRNHELEMQLERINSARIYMENKLLEINEALEAAHGCNRYFVAELTEAKRKLESINMINLKSSQAH